MSTRVKRWTLALTSPFLVIAWARAIVWTVGIEWDRPVAVIVLSIAAPTFALAVALTATAEGESGDGK